jgi:hypothetical protein
MFVATVALIDKEDLQVEMNYVPVLTLAGLFFSSVNYPGTTSLTGHCQFVTLLRGCRLKFSMALVV